MDRRIPSAWLKASCAAPARGSRASRGLPSAGRLLAARRQPRGCCGILRGGGAAMSGNMPDEPFADRDPASPIETVILPRTRDLGDGFEVRRALPSMRRRMVGPFIFLDQMGPMVLRSGQGLDVRPHPHIGLATVTYLFEGEI